MRQIYQDYMNSLDTLHRDFQKTIEDLSVAALDWVPGREMNSLCVLVVHTMGATRYWAGDIAAGIPSNRNRSAEFEAHGLDEPALKNRMDETLAFVQSIVDKLSLEDLEHTVPISANHPGRTFTIGNALVHALEHTAQHLGHAQITRQLWDHNYGTK